MLTVNSDWKVAGAPSLSMCRYRDHYEKQNKKSIIIAMMVLTNTLKILDNIVISLYAIVTVALIYIVLHLLFNWRTGKLPLTPIVSIMAVISYLEMFFMVCSIRRLGISLFSSLLMD